jgi:Spy/CpxP family protein refolding chaperone
MFGYKNTFGRSLILASVLALTGGIAVADDDAPAASDGDKKAAHHDGDRDGKRHHAKRGEDGKRGERGDRKGSHDKKRMHKRLFEGMELTEEQRTQIHEAMKAHGEERKAWHEANKDAFQAIKDKMRAAHEAKDKEAGEAARAEIKALMETGPKPDAVSDTVRGVLNAEQQATYDERVAKMRERMEQWKKGRGEGRGHDKDGKGEHGDRSDGKRSRAGRAFGNLDLTEEQKASLRETMQSSQTREEKMAAVRGMLTDEQKAQLDENIAKMKKYREEHKGERGEKRGRHGDHDGDGDRPKRERKQDGDGKQLDL